VEKSWPPKTPTFWTHKLGIHDFLIGIFYNKAYNFLYTQSSRQSSCNTGESYRGVMLNTFNTSIFVNSDPSNFHTSRVWAELENAYGNIFVKFILKTEVFST